MPSLILAEHDNRTLSDGTARTVTAAMQLGEPVHVLVAGHACSAVAAMAARLNGVAAVIVADDPLYAYPVAETVTALLLTLKDRYSAFLAPATASGKATLPRLAALLDTAQISEITKVLAPDTFERPLYAGAVLQTVKAPPGPLVATVRPAAFEPAPLGGSALIATIPAGPDPALTACVQVTPSASGRPVLSSAAIVISGGRGVQTADNFKVLEKIAARLQAAIGASRAAVDAGFLPNDCQIGQTGKVVAPKLYIAVGISGAIQHLAGMKESKIIVAINQDDEAPIFQIANFGLVADLYQALPEMDAQLAERGYN